MTDVGVSDYLFDVACAFLRHPKTHALMREECHADLQAWGMEHLIKVKQQ